MSGEIFVWVWLVVIERRISHSFCFTWLIGLCDFSRYLAEKVRVWEEFRLEVKN